MRLCGFFLPVLQFSMKHLELYSKEDRVGPLLGAYLTLAEI